MEQPHVTAETPGSAAGSSLEIEDMDRIAFELWQRGSLPEAAKDLEAELEEVACHSSCL